MRAFNGRAFFLRLDYFISFLLKMLFYGILMNFYNSVFLAKGHSLYQATTIIILFRSKGIFKSSHRLYRSFGIALFTKGDY